MHQHRMSPAILVAVLALVAALAGTAVAGPDALTKTITKKKVKKIAKKEARKYFDANIANASVASATNAQNATNATTATNVSGRTPFNIKLDFGQTQTIASNGPVSVEANCFAGGGTHQAQILAQTTQNGSILEGVDKFFLGNFNTGTAPGNRRLLVASFQSGFPAVRNTTDNGFVMAPDGKWLGVDGEQTALGVNYAGADCILAGVVQASG